METLKKILALLIFISALISEARAEGGKKVALLFLTRKDVLHPNLWIELLKNCEDKFNIYVHSKEMMNNKYFRKHRIQNTVHTTWTRHVKAWKALLEEALKDKHNYKFVYLSESCAPLKPMEEIYEILTKDRISYVNYMRPFWPENNAREVREIPKEHRWVNSEWVILNRRHALTIVKDKSVIGACHRHPHSSEAHPSSLFSCKGNLIDLELKNRATTYVNFTLGHDSHPYTFENGSPFNIGLIREAKAKGCLFIRKIGPRFPKGVLLGIIKEKG